MAKNKPKSKKSKSHPWRICPGSEHWVVTHPRLVSKGVTQVSGYCRANRSRKDQIYIEELLHIAEKYFSKVKLQPKADILDFKY